MVSVMPNINIGRPQISWPRNFSNSKYNCSSLIDSQELMLFILENKTELEKILKENSNEPIIHNTERSDVL